MYIYIYTYNVQVTSGKDSTDKTFVIQVHTDIASFVSKHFHLRTENKGTSVSFPVISDCSPPQFSELSRAIEEPAVRRSQASDMLWMKLKLNGAPKRNRSRWCSEIWEYEKQNCKGICTTFLVSDGGPSGSSTKINQKKRSKNFWDKKFVTKSPWASQNATKQSCYEKLFFLDEKMFEKSSNLWKKWSKIFGDKKMFMPRSPRLPILGGDRCAVAEIKFPGRDLGGALHPEISNLTALWFLDLDDTNVSGSLDVLANNTELENLYLRHTRVTGRLEDLRLKAKDLRSLDLTGTEVTGDLAALANATKLRYLHLSNTAVFGELKSLAQLKELKKLDLANLKVVGELKSLVKLTGLTWLDLSNTGVSGELKSLAKLTELQKLELANLKVGGDVAVMAEWSKLEHVDLSGTHVGFDLFQQFGPYNRTEFKWQCKWQKLRFLDVSRTSQFSPAQDLLRPLLWCGKLATLKAAGCGLSGPLWPEILNPHGASYSIDWWPLSQALSVLDFARNNVTDVAKLPGSCRTLVLTGNPHVSFGPGAVEKAIGEMVFIDLRNATFGNPSDSLLLIGQLAVITHVLLSICSCCSHFICWEQ